MCWSEKGKGPITSSEKNDVERITSMGLEVVERAYDIYIQSVGEVVELLAPKPLLCFEEDFFSPLDDVVWWKMLLKFLIMVLRPIYHS